MKKLLFVLAFVAFLTLPLFASAWGAIDIANDYNKTVEEDYDNGKYGDELYYLANLIGQYEWKGDISISVKDGKATLTFYPLWKI